VSRLRFADRLNGWIFGPDLWATHDGGATWHRLTRLGGPVRALEASGGTAWALVGAPGGGPSTVFASATKEDQWKPVGADAIDPSATIDLHVSFGFTSAADGSVLALGPGGLDRRGTPCPGSKPADVASHNANDVAALCVGDVGAGSSTKTLMLSHDGARTWSNGGTAPRGGQVEGLAASSPGTYVVAASSGASFLYRTTDAGVHWATVYQDSTAGGAPLSDLGFTDDQHGVAILGDSGHSRLLISADAGATWTTQAFGP
jgi:photosystem II stability/assembly factor-like uncharacterized protein